MVSTILCGGILLTGCGGGNDTNSLNSQHFGSSGNLNFNSEPTYSSNIEKIGTFRVDSKVLSGIIDTTNTKAFVMTENSIKVFDISNINSPTLLKEYDITGNKIYLSKDNKKLFIGKSYKIIILDVTDPKNPQTIKEILGNFSDFVLSNDEKTIFAINSNLLSLIDITDPTNPDIKSTLIYLPGGKKLHISDDDKKLYVMLIDGLTIIDVSDKTNPTKKDKYSTSLEPNDMAVSKDDRVAILSTGMGLVILNVSNPDNIQKIRDYENKIGNQFRDTIIVSNNKVFTIKNFEVDILDITNPNNPKKEGYISFIGSLDMPERIFLSKDKTKLFVKLGGKEKVYIFNVSSYTK